jgi:hypothetical protein
MLSQGFTRFTRRAVRGTGRHFLVSPISCIIHFTPFIPFILVNRGIRLTDHGNRPAREIPFDWRHRSGHLGFVRRPPRAKPARRPQIREPGQLPDRFPSYAIRIAISAWILASPVFSPELAALTLLAVIGSALFSPVFSDEALGLEGSAGGFVRAVACVASAFFFSAFLLYFCTHYVVNKPGAPFGLLALFSTIAVVLRPALARRFERADYLRVLAVIYLLAASIARRMLLKDTGAPLLFPQILLPEWPGAACIAAMAAGFLILHGRNGWHRAGGEMLFLAGALILVIRVRLPVAAFALFSDHPDTWYHVLRTRVYTTTMVEIENLSRVSYCDSLIYPLAIMHIWAAAMVDFSNTLVAHWARFSQPLLQSVAIFAGLFLLSLRRGGSRYAVTGAALAALFGTLFPHEPVKHGWAWLGATSAYVSQFFATACLVLMCGLMSRNFDVMSSPLGAVRRPQRILAGVCCVAAMTVTLWSHVLTMSGFFAGLFIAWLATLFRRSPHWKPMLAVGAATVGLLCIYLAQYLVAKSHGQITYDLKDQVASQTLSYGQVGEMLWSSFGIWPVPILGLAVWNTWRANSLQRGADVVRLALLAAVGIYISLIVGIPVPLVPGRMNPVLGACLVLLAADGLASLWHLGSGAKQGPQRTAWLVTLSLISLVPLAWSWPFKQAPPPPRDNAMKAVLHLANTNSCDASGSVLSVMRGILFSQPAETAFVVPYSVAGNWASGFTKSPVYLYHDGGTSITRSFIGRAVKDAATVLDLDPDTTIVFWMTGESDFTGNRENYNRQLSTLCASVPRLKMVIPNHAVAVMKASEALSDRW